MRSGGGRLAGEKRNISVYSVHRNFLHFPTWGVRIHGLRFRFKAGFYGVMAKI